MASPSVTSTSALFQRARVRSEPGAKLYFYLSGTSTPANTYQDTDLSTAHTNPVIADADGYFDPIYLDSSLGYYRYTLTDADDVTIEGPIDDIPSGVPLEGSFTGILIGVSGLSTGTVFYYLVGSMVHLSVPTGFAGASNSTGMSIANLPGEIVPSGTRLGLCTFTNDDAGEVPTLISVSNGGTVTFMVQTLTDADPAGYTASGTKGIPSGWFATYAL